MAGIGDEELRKLEELFGTWGLETKLRNVEDLQKLMETKKEVKKERKDSHRDTIPKLPIFTGKDDSNATPFELWEYDVTCLMNEYSEEVVMESMRRSLRGEAAMVMVREGPGLKPRAMLEKLEGLYGTVAPDSTLLSRFYRAEQETGEEVSTWVCRLEGYIKRVQQQGLISAGTKEEMLRTKIWTGLTNQELKQATRHSFDTIKNVHELVVKLRSVELEMGNGSIKGKKEDKGEKTKVKSQAIHKTESGSVYDLVKELGNKMERMEKEIADIKSQQQQFSQGSQQYSSSGYNRSGRGRGRSRGKGRGQYYKPQLQAPAPNSVSSEPKKEKKISEDVVCYRCGEVGHIALGCRVRTDHLHHLNDELPLSGGEQ